MSTESTALDERLGELESLLSDELSAYTHLVNRLPFKLALIKKNRAAQLERLMAQEAEEMQVLAGIERQRAAIMTALSAQLPAPVATLRELLAQLSGARAERLGKLGDELRAKVADLQAGNQTCRELLRLSIDYATYTLDLIAQAAAPEGMTYDGSVAQAPSLLLDRRA